MLTILKGYLAEVSKILLQDIPSMSLVFCSDSAKETIERRLQGKGVTIVPYSQMSMFFLPYLDHVGIQTSSSRQQIVSEATLNLIISEISTKQSFTFSCEKVCKIVAEYIRNCPSEETLLSSPNTGNAELDTIIAKTIQQCSNLKVFTNKMLDLKCLSKVSSLKEKTLNEIFDYNKIVFFPTILSSVLIGFASEICKVSRNRPVTVGCAVSTGKYEDLKYSCNDNFYQSFINSLSNKGILFETKICEKKDIKVQALSSSIVNKEQKRIPHFQVTKCVDIRAEINNAAINIKGLLREGVSSADIVICSDNEDIQSLYSDFRSIFQSLGISLYCPLQRMQSTLLRTFLDIVLRAPCDGNSIALFASISPDKADYSSVVINFFQLYGEDSEEAFTRSEKSSGVDRNITVSVFNKILALRKDIETSITFAEGLKKLCTITRTFVKEVLKKSCLSNLQTSNIIAQWNSFVSVLEQLFMVYEKRSFQSDFFSYSLFALLDNKDVYPIKESGSIFLCNIDYAALGLFRYVFVLGANDGAFPEINETFEDIFPANPLFRSSKEVEKLSFFHIANILSTEHLYISYSAQSLKKSKMKEALEVYRLNKIFSENIKISETLSVADIFANTLAELSVYRNVGKLSSSAVAAIEGLFDNVPLYSERLQNAIAWMFVDRTNFHFSEPLAVKKDSYGVTELESYNNCPFSYAIKNVLRVFPNKEFGEKSSDKGVFVHSVLKEFFSSPSAENLREGSFEDIKQYVLSLCESVAVKHNNGILLEDKFSFTRKDLYDRCVFAVVALESQLSKGAFLPRFTEKPIKKAFCIDGKEISLTGIIDRVDESDSFVRIIDYKTGLTEFSRFRQEKGVALQLPIYAKAEVDEEVKPCAGMYYFHACDPVSNEGTLSKKYLMSGISLNTNDALAVIDKGLDAPKSSSTVIHAARTVSGDLSKNSQVTSEDDMQEILSTAEDRALDTIRNIQLGNFQALPIINAKENLDACKYCDYQIICHFEKSRDKYRF